MNVPPVDFQKDFLPLSKICKLTKKRVRNDYDVLVAITGYEGTGKSVFAYWYGVGSASGFKVENNIFFETGFDKIKEKYSKINRYGVALFDEAVKQFNKRRHMTKDNVSMTQLFAMCRDENKINILCIPRLNMLDKFFRDGRSFLRFHVISHGLAVVLKADVMNPHGDPWYTRESEKRFNTAREILSAQGNQDELTVVMRAFKTDPNFLCFTTCNDMPEEVKLLYKRYKTEHKYDGIEEEVKMGSAWIRTRKTIAKYRYFLNQLGFIQKEIAEVEGVHKTAISQLLRNPDKEITEEIDDWIKDNHKLIKSRLDGGVLASES
jgi:hypothetical protein